MQKFTNFFRKGLHKGIDLAQQSNETYIDAQNIRVIRNSSSGTWAVTNAKGLEQVFILAANYGQDTDYQPIGHAYVNGALIVLTTNGTNSEIGIVKQDQFNSWNYQTAYNDLYDPYEKLLYFSLQFNARCNAVQENNAIERIYWNDNHNEPRVFNILLGIQALNPDFTSGDYLPIGGASPGNVYPDYYSVHGMAQMPDLTWGLIKYVQNIPGSLLSGERQYCFRYIHKTGYTSPWSYLTDTVMMSSKNVDNGNWTKYDMGVSGATTNKGHQLEIKYLDERFQKVQVACVYWQNPSGANSATIIFTGEIAGPSIDVLHTVDTGEIVTIDELQQRFFNIKRAKTQSIHRDNYLQFANVELYGDLQIDTEGITIEPNVRRMLSDTNDTVTTVPLTHQALTADDSVPVSLCSGSGGSIIEDYSIVDDYINYKGTQWAHMFKAYFRREAYPWAIVVWNRKGQPLFAQHISDYTLPEQYNNDFTDARLSGTTTGTVGSVGDYVLTNYDAGSTYQITNGQQQGNEIVLKIMGLKFGNIDLTDILFDDNGDLQVSGFSIVRMDRVPTIVSQGLLCNTVRNTTPSGSCNYTDETRPLPSAYNYLSTTGASNPSSIDIGQMQDYCNIAARGYWHTFETPDFMFDESIFETSTSSDKIRLVGACVPSFKSVGFEDEMKELDGSNNHYYDKKYQTYASGFDTILDGNNVTGDAFGNDYSVEYLFANTGIEVNPILGALYWVQYSGLQAYQSMDAAKDYSAIAHRQNLLLGLDLDTCSIKYGDSHCVHFIANYLRNVAASQITQSVLENRVYHNIGHFVPINATTLAAAFDGSRYIFNDVEVWGGDCYVDYFGFARLLPAYLGPGYNKPGDCGYWNHASPHDYYPDYAIGLFFPIESKLNFTMQTGASYYPKAATQPFATYCGDAIVFQDGTYYIDEDNNRFEDFYLNKVLQTQDIISQYNAKITLLNKEQTEYPLIEMYAGPKFYGENYDTYRHFLINNFQFAQGEYGEITAIDNLFGSIYVFQHNAVSRMRFNERELINTASGTVNTGTGKGYSGHDYISTELGCQHQFSLVNSGRSIYFMDAEKGKMLRFGQDGINPISDTYDAWWIQDVLRDFWAVPDPDNLFLQKYYDNPTYMGGIHGIYDFQNDAVLYTFTKRVVDIDSGDPVYVGTPITIEYSEASNAFQAEHSSHPKWYMGMKQSVLSLNPETNGGFVWAHNDGRRGNIYGTYFQSSIKFVVNPIPGEAKVFDNGSLGVRGSGVVNIETVIGETELVASQAVILNNSVVDNRPVYREGRLQYPIMQKGQAVRLRGNYCTVEFLINNSADDEEVIITEHQTLFRLSSRL